MSVAADLVAQLVAAGTPPELLAAVAQELFAGEIERKALADRRRNERDRKANQRASREVTGSHGTTRDNRGQSPKVSPKDINQTPSSPPVDVSEADASSHQPRPWSLPVGVSLQVWTDLKANRKRKRLGETPTAWKAFNDDLARVSVQTGIPPPKLIEMCAAKGWGAIYDPRTENEQRTNGTGRNQPNDGLSSTARAALQVFGH